MFGSINTVRTSSWRTLIQSVNTGAACQRFTFNLPKTLFCPLTRFDLFKQVSSRTMSTDSLSADEVRRYSRQLILPEIGVEGQLRLKNGSVLIVGCGGLGCPSSMYLAAAGVGRIGLVDHDTVELSNLHRQVLHTEQRVDQMNKADSIQQQLSQLNSHVEFVPIKERLTGANACQLVSQYDVVIDATDNAPTRYLISDACALTKRPLVSGAALRWDGQLITYNYGSNGPCYRCLYPNAPPAGTVTNCSDGGVVGVIPGIIGSFQALETIKLLAGLEPSYAGQMLLFDGFQGSFRKIQVRNRRADCQACGSNPSIRPETFNYEAFCGTRSCDKTQQIKLLHDLERITVQQYKEIVDSKQPHLLIDVRPANDYKIVQLPDSVSIPLAQLQTQAGIEKFVHLVGEQRSKQCQQVQTDYNPDCKPKVKVYVLCKLGNSSQRAVDFLKKNVPLDDQIEMKDICGGITAWAQQIDTSLPTY